MGLTVSKVPIGAMHHSRTMPTSRAQAHIMSASRWPNVLLTLMLCSTIPTVSVGHSGSEGLQVLVYGSTPSDIMAAVAAARHGASVGVLSQRAHIGGVCSGGLGQTDIGSDAEKVIGGLALEFFKRSAERYATQQPRAPWNLEPHVAREVFLAMMNESGVVLLPPSQVASVALHPGTRRIQSVQVETGAVYSAEVFVDASYEGDLMARTEGVSYTYGRESRETYNETNAGKQGTTVKYGIEYMDPFTADGQLLPLLKNGSVLPVGAADREVQAYNFRLCVTDNASLKIPFTKPADYDPKEWELLRRFWTGWPNSTNPHKESQAKVPSAILGEIPSTTGAHKYDANNCGYNPVHTDMIGGSWEYPEANYTHRETMWQAHVSYTKGFLWFMSSDLSVPATVRAAYANDWGYCGDEFHETDHFPPQLYVREARRLVGEKVFTENDVRLGTPLGNRSIGLGSYGFDAHAEQRYACVDKNECALYPRPYVAIQSLDGGVPPGVYQMPLSLLLPRRTQATNLLVPVCSSASHVAYATVRMEPQFMILGHAAGVVAALTVHNVSARQLPLNPRENLTNSSTPNVQDVDTSTLAAMLLSDGALLNV
eukprot:m.542714 g.542714  ORF g.542714 m.542714 type:complete len:598 (+) comp22120_c0_seq16:123-1916(+)